MTRYRVLAIDDGRGRGHAKFIGEAFTQKEAIGLARELGYPLTTDEVIEGVYR